ncbi:oxidoreductase [Sporosarcina sp. NCCP-2716]|uniref:NAD(P)-dependent oxidoreductase n=1 Tax=Sporosarcina sp. NCCP-2716 TaxID=2943679 RepID=UPI00203C8522|nr:SDR family oxidoreductase [Sporosarcina sp. NCCP-2716]GKV68518.1 oxidoreductase [Sporosarcina sp. NCCP-2716]
MKVALFGSTGRVGSKMLRQLLAEGHEVTVLVRDAGKLESHPQLTVVTGDAKNGADVHNTVQGADCVASALGTDKSTVLSEAVPHMIAAMEGLQIRRILTIGTAGILQSRLESGRLRYEAGDSNRKLTRAAEEHHAAYRALADSALEWTIVCPTYLPDGKDTGTYRIEDDWLPEGGDRISTGDTAHFAVQELSENGHVRHRVGIAY